MRREIILGNGTGRVYPQGAFNGVDRRVRVREGVTIDAEVKVMWPQAKGCRQPLELERQRLDSSPQREPVLLACFRPPTPELREEHLFSASMLVLIC